MDIDSRNQTDLGGTLEEPKKRLRLIPPKDHFSVPANDANHKSARANFRLMPSMVRQIEIATRKGNPFGWLTPSDFHRWATKMGLARVTEMMDDPFLSNLNQETNAIIRHPDT
jgi:hypothetical protein